MLRATDLRFRYQEGGPWIVDGASLGVEAGETVAIMGPSGSGKTTLRYTQKLWMTGCWLGRDVLS